MSGVTLAIPTTDMVVILWEEESQHRYAIATPTSGEVHLTGALLEAEYVSEALRVGLLKYQSLLKQEHTTQGTQK